MTLGTTVPCPPADVMPSAKSALKNALEIDDELAEAYACRGCVRSVFDWSWAEAERDFLRAIELNPSYQRHITGTRSTTSCRAGDSTTRA